MNTQKARDLVNDQFKLKDRAAARWGGTALILAVLALGLGGMCVTLANDVKVIPYIVQVDQHGYEVAVGPLQAPDTTDERVVMSRVATFVNRWRTIVTDPAAQKDLIDWVYSSIPAGTNAEASINDWYAKNDPYKSARLNQTRTVEVKTVLKVSPETWRVEWEENDAEKGFNVKATRWTGLFTIGITPPKALQQVLKNPLGIYIVEYSANTNLN